MAWYSFSNQVWNCKTERLIKITLLFRFVRSHAAALILPLQTLAINKLYRGLHGEDHITKNLHQATWFNNYQVQLDSSSIQIHSLGRGVCIVSVSAIMMRKSACSEALWSQPWHHLLSNRPVAHLKKVLTSWHECWLVNRDEKSSLHPPPSTDQTRHRAPTSLVVVFELASKSNWCTHWLLLKILRVESVGIWKLDCGMHLGKYSAFGVCGNETK